MRKIRMITALLLALIIVSSMPLSALAATQSADVPVNTDIPIAPASSSEPVIRNPVSYTVMEKDEPLHLGPNIIRDPDSVTGYTVKFLYHDENASRVEFLGDLMLCDWSNPDERHLDATVYSPQEYRPGMMRRGGTVGLGRPGVNYRVDMVKDPETNIWYTEVPLAAGANQYWFSVDGGSRMMPDPANMPIWSPGSNWNTKNAYNSVYVPYDAEKQNYEPLAARVVELPRTDGKTGTLTWDDLVISGTTRYLGVYTPHGFDPNREEPYKTIYMLHGGGQDESDWMGIGSVQNIMDNLLADGLTEPAVVVTMSSAALGNAANGFSGLFDSIIPYVEANYNTSDKAVDRSFGGLSMGSSITANIINNNALGFGYYCLFSLSGGNAIINADNLEVPRYYFADGGYEQPLSRNPGDLPNTDTMFVTAEFAGAHDFNTWNQTFADYVKNYLWKPEMFASKEGPSVIKDPDSPTGYTGRFVYKDEDAEQVYFCGDLNLSNHADPSDTTIYPPQEYQPGMMRRGGSQFKVPMEKGQDGYWYYELPLTAGANQYWFNVDSGTRMLPDPANHPKWSPGSNWNTKNAYNAVYVPYDAEKQDYEPLAARVVENPRTDEKTGTWSYVPITIADTQRYMGVYLPYGYDPDREEPYKTIYMQHGGGQDESDWMGIGSVQNIMDNLLADGLAEPAVIVTTGSTYLGAAAEGYPNLRNVILPFIEENYNVSGKAEDRSFAGLSMGSMITANIINYDALQFGYYGLFSGSNGASVANAENLMSVYMLFGDGLYENSRSVSALEGIANYDYLRFAGAHDFNTWCQLFTVYVRDYLWNPDAFKDEPVPGPIIVADPDSPTGYTGKFIYFDDEAETVYFCGDLMLSNHADPSDTAIYSPFEYRPGMMRRGGAQFKEEMEYLGDGYWYYELPLTAGANQYWFNVDSGTRMLPDPANHPKWSPGSNWNTKNAYNAVYVPYDAEKQNYAPLAARVVENPRTDEKTGTWSYVPVTIADTQRYLGVYLPYGYDADSEEQYKTIYMLHGGGQDESDWMGIGSVQNIMDNLLADGLTAPAIVVTMASAALGHAANGYTNLYNDILPFIEENYNVSDKADDRSFAGLSMGGGITAELINVDALAFGYFGVFSSGGLRTHTVQGENINVPNIFIGNGLYENDEPMNRHEYALRFMRQLDEFDAKYAYVRFAGAHDFNTWCQTFTTYARDYLWKPEMFEKVKEGPTVIKDPDSPTGYTVQFVYKNEEASRVQFVGDILLRNHANPDDTTVYTPFEFRPGFMRGGGAYEADMVKLEGGYWFIEVPLSAGANQYWFYVDGDRNHWVTDPANPPLYAPDGLTGNARRAFNAVYVPYDAEKQNYEPLAAREIENPRSDDKTGTWSYVPFEVDDTTRYLGVYLPYGYDPDRSQPYKTIYMQHGGGQDSSDWMNIGSVPHIMDNLLADGLTEPAIVVTTDSRYLGAAASGYPNLFNIILPFVEANYNVSDKAADRSFAGLSMGGMITTNIIKYDATKFGYYGIFSGGGGSSVAGAENLGLVYMLFGNGLYERLTDFSDLEGTDANYKYLRFAGAHDFNSWCQLFTTYARDYLWKPEAFKDEQVKISSTISTIVEGFAANIPVEVEYASEAVEITVGLYGPGGELVSSITVSGNGKYTFNLSAADAVAGIYTVKADGAESDVAITCISKPASLWSPSFAVVNENTVSIAFAADVSFNAKGKGIKVDGVTLDAANATASGNVITITGLESGQWQEIAISGVVYPELFPSYHFTFTVRQ